MRHEFMTSQPVNRRDHRAAHPTSSFLCQLAISLSLCLWQAGSITKVIAAETRPEKPNVIIINCDDLGYADVGAFGATICKTPQIDRLAREGVKATSFYVAQAVCSASRTALLTGCLPNRIGILGALSHVSKNGIADSEVTLGELFQSQGYSTAMYGKWHLGCQAQFLPGRHGFDEAFGIPYSNDMWSKNPYGKFPPLPLFRQKGDSPAEIIGHDTDQSRFTTDFTMAAVSFIDRHADKPFFIYLAHPMPHTPIFVSEERNSGDRAQLYRDVIGEIDWSVGTIRQTLEKHQLTRKTLVIFTSDNGPWLVFGNHAGSTGPLREGKGTMWDGGARVPFVACWPGVIPPDTTVDLPMATYDLFPTFAKMLGAKLPDHPIDGVDIWPQLTGTSKVQPHKSLWFYYGRDLIAVRSGPWKLVFPHTYVHPVERGNDGQRGKLVNQKFNELALYNLESDIGETTNLASQHPEIVAQLEAYAEVARNELGDALTNRKGSGVRPPGTVNDSPSLGN
jgi:arylsulfatase A